MGEGKGGEKHGCSGPGVGNGDQLQSEKRVKAEVKEEGLGLPSRVSEESQERLVLLFIQGEPGPPGMRVQGPQVSLQPFLFLPVPPLPPATLSLTSCPLPSTLKTTELCPLPHAQGYSSGIESCNSLGLASVGDLGFDLSEPQGLLEALFCIRAVRHPTPNCRPVGQVGLGSHGPVCLS